MKYKKVDNNPRLNVQFLNSDTDEVIFEVKNRTWMNIGELLSEDIVTQVISQNIKGEIPVNLMVLVVGEYELSE